MISLDFILDCHDDEWNLGTTTVGMDFGQEFVFVLGGGGVICFVGGGVMMKMQFFNLVVDRGGGENVRQFLVAAMSFGQQFCKCWHLSHSC